MADATFYQAAKAKREELLSKLDSLNGTVNAYKNAVEDLVVLLKTLDKELSDSETTALSKKVSSLIGSSTKVHSAVLTHADKALDEYAKDMEKDEVDDEE